MQRFMVVVALVVMIALAASPADAVIVTYSGQDPGVGSGGPWPDSDMAASMFDADVNPSMVLDLEGLPAGSFGSLTIAPGVDVSHSGLSSASIEIDDLSNPELGFNTTLGGRKYMEIVPQAYIGTAVVTFEFDEPIDAFGAYFTGLEDFINGDLHIVFDDGSVQDLMLPEFSDAGAQFFGFESPGSLITQIDLELRNVGSSFDWYGIDDIRIRETIIPEPASMAVWSILGLVGLGAMRRRRTLVQN